MISRLRGKLLRASGGICEIEVAGVGYEVKVGDRPLPALGSDLSLFTHLHQRDEGPSLFGFLSAEEKAAFHMLLGVHGVGPKLAQSAVVALGLEGLSRALRDRDVAALSKVPGLGRKRAETLIQELKDKNPLAVGGKPPAEGFSAAPEDEAVEGLRTLGYKDDEIARALASAGKGGTEARLREALRLLGGAR